MKTVAIAITFHFFLFLYQHALEASVHLTSPSNIAISVLFLGHLKHNNILMYFIYLEKIYRYFRDVFNLLKHLLDCISCVLSVQWTKMISFSPYACALWVMHWT